MSADRETEDVLNRLGRLLADVEDVLGDVGHLLDDIEDLLDELRRTDRWAALTAALAVVVFVFVLLAVAL